ncbi:MAG: cell division protein FtsL [Pseudomonadota bacterium]|nr:cell division protein FtsL [Pseudomonadota bacterium]|tara:strand:+ start:283 stop:552 length:270 start_codon:yes stop_codon:yes gene_type:complete
MRKFLFISLISFLIIFTSIIKSSTRSLESQIFNLQEEIIIKKNKKQTLLLENNYLSSPERLFELKEDLFGDTLVTIKINQIINLKKKHE